MDPALLIAALKEFRCRRAVENRRARPYLAKWLTVTKERRLMRMVITDWQPFIEQRNSASGDATPPASPDDRPRVASPDDADDPPSPEDADDPPSRREAEAPQSRREAEDPPSPKEAEDPPSPREAEDLPSPREAEALLSPGEAEALLSPGEVEDPLSPGEVEDGPSPRELEDGPSFEDGEDPPSPRGLEDPASFESAEDPPSPVGAEDPPSFGEDEPSPPRAIQSFPRELPPPRDVNLEEEDDLGSDDEPASPPPPPVARIPARIGSPRARQHSAEPLEPMDDRRRSETFIWNAMTVPRFREIVDAEAAGEEPPFIVDNDFQTPWRTMAIDLMNEVISDVRARDFPHAAAYANHMLQDLSGRRPALVRRTYENIWRGIGRATADVNAALFRSITGWIAYVTLHDVVGPQPQPLPE